MAETEELVGLLNALPGESSRAHSAFLRYVSLGRQRSVDKAYFEMYGRGQSGGNGGSRSATFFQEWSIRFRWHDRVQQYEAGLKFEYVRIMCDQHFAEISQYASDRLREGKQLSEMARAMAAYGAKQLRRLVEDNTPMDCDQAARFLRAMAFVSMAATEAKADALSVKHLTSQLEEHRKAEEETAI